MRSVYNSDDEPVVQDYQIIIVPEYNQSNQKLLLIIGILILSVICLSILSPNPSLQLDQIAKTEPLSKKQTSQHPQNPPQAKNQKKKNQVKKDEPEKIQKEEISRNQSNQIVQENNFTNFPFEKRISQIKQMIDRIEKSFSTYQCLEIMPMFHQHHERAFTMYFQTYYQNLLPSCDNLYNYKWSVNRDNIRAWNQDRHAIQWAFYNIQENDHILYYREGAYNLPQIIMLNKIIGQRGSLTILQAFQSNRCIPETLNLGGMPNNVKYLSFSGVSSFQPFTVIIANQSLFDKYANKNVSSKMLIYSNDGGKLKQKQILKPFNIFKFSLKDKVCGIGIFDKELSGTGFYSITPYKQFQRKQLKRQIVATSKFGSLQSKYVSFKQKQKSRLLTKVGMLQSYSKQSLCIDPESRRAFPQYILTIYGHKLYDVTVEEVVQWEKERGPIEWVRTNKHLGSNSYYEMKGGLSILAIIQIAFIIGNDTLIVVCPLPQRSRVLNQLEKNEISNVILLNETSLSEALSSRIVITDNQELIKTCVDKNFSLNGGFVLGFFTAKRNESVAAMRKLYIKNQLREIVTPNANTECAGFQYQHYFWNSWNPNGFYQIRPSKYIIYTFWGDSPQKLNSRKKFLIEQMVKMDVEVKIISSQGFLYFQVQGTPIHPAFFLLTSTHKSDYFRVYLMHHYGGAYADVKHTHFQWKPFFEKLQKDQKKYVYGYSERTSLDVPCVQSGPPLCSQIILQYARIIGNGHYIFKKQTPLTAEWFKTVTDNINRKYQALKKNPSRVPRQEYKHTFRLKNGTTFVSQYPFDWAEIANIHLVRAQYKFLDKVEANLPYVLMADYRTSNNLDQN